TPSACAGFSVLHRPVESALIGGRYDRANTGQNASPVSLDAAKAGRIGLTDRQFSPRVGVLYELREGLSVYGSYTESFGVNNGLSATGEAFDPECAEQWEIGFKAESADKRLTSTVSLFDLTRDNMLTADPADSLFQIVAGEARSRGIEADVSGQITDRLKLLATFAHMDARYVRNNDGLQGNRLENAPHSQGSVWGTWQFNDAYKAGLGVIAVGERMGDAANSYRLSGYGRVDALVAYTQRIGQNRLTAQLNVYNLLDKKYYASGGGRASIMPGMPRSFLASVKYEF
ncbi:MAG: TonB-dependent receptor, partial [Rhodocyclaceae bacterium]|nr:TonB-dependent receptor [Rhodocyclaceae bacterium]